MGPNSRTFALLMVCALLAALGLSACGGGDDESTTSAGETTAETTSPPEDETTTETGGGKTKGGEQTTEGDGDSDQPAPSATGPGVDPSERSAEFVTPGGDNSIQEFGEEGDEDERAEALKVITAISRASEDGKWGEVCAKYISAKNLEQFETVAEKIPKFKGAGCAEILSGLSPGQGIKSPSRPKGGVASVRGDGENAFAIYRGADGNGYGWPMAVESDGSLKATALAPTPLQAAG